MADPVLSTIGASDSTHLAKGIDQRRLNALEHRMPGVNLHVPRKRVKELRLRSHTAASAQPVAMQARADSAAGGRTQCQTFHPVDFEYAHLPR